MAIAACRKARQVRRHLRAGPVRPPGPRAVAGRAGHREHVAQPGHGRRDLAAAGGARRPDRRRRCAASRRAIAAATRAAFGRSTRRDAAIARAMRGMQPPPRLRLVPAPVAHRAARAIGIAAPATSRCSSSLPLPIAVAVALARLAVVLAALASRIVALHAAAACRRCVHVGARSARHRVHRERRPLARRRERSTTRTSARALTTIVWRPDGARCVRRARSCVLPDMLPADDFRRLRVMLRYGAQWRRGDERRRRGLTGQPCLSVDAARRSRAFACAARAGAGTAAPAPRAAAAPRLSSPGMRLVAQRRADRARDDGVDAQVRAVLPFVGQFARERRHAGLGDGVAAPVRARLLAASVEREDDARIAARRRAAASPRASAPSARRR